MVKVGDIIGNYRLVAEINSGTYGGVYTAKHIIFKDAPIVAVKVLHAYLASQEERDQFIQEALLLKKLKHPYILSVIDAGMHKHSLYLILEFARNGSLKDRIQRQSSKPFPIDETLTIISHIGEALLYAHQQEQPIVHRDLKPANILFNANGDVLLADFGIAKVLTSGKTRQAGTGGTILYMAPEQFEGLISTKSDQYALGCIAYELFTGRCPFIVAYPTPETLWYQHAKVQPTPPRQFNPNLPVHIEQAILKAMEKNRANRHDDISIFIKALHTNKEQWLEEGVAHYKAGRNGKAFRAFEQAILLDPNYALAYYNKGEVLSNVLRFDEALAAYERAIELDPTIAKAYSAKGSILRVHKQYEEALRAYERAIELDSSDAGAYLGKGSVLYRLKRYEEAVKPLERAIELGPTVDDGYMLLGEILCNLGRYEEAVRIYDQAIEWKPNYFFSYLDKGAVLIRLGRDEDALRAYELAIEAFERIADYENNGIIKNLLAPTYRRKGILLERLGKTKQAQQAYEKARQLGYKE